MRVLVTGGRDFANRSCVWSALAMLLPVQPGRVLIHGACPTGADAHADAWATYLNARIVNIENVITIECFPANWGRDGKAAGPIRNSRMLAEGKPDIVLAFPGGRGTADMVRKAKAAGVMVLEVTPAKQVPRG